MRNFKTISKINFMTKALLLSAMTGCVFLCPTTLAPDIKKAELNTSQDKFVLALHNKMEKTESSCLAINNELRVRDQEYARLKYISKREEMQKERLTNNSLRCL